MIFLKIHFQMKLKQQQSNQFMKKKNCHKIENYRPVSILSCSLKDYEKFVLEKFKLSINSFLSKFIVPYGENYRSNNVLIRPIESWKKGPNEDFLMGTVIMDL